jgi:hypothetical protein
MRGIPYNSFRFILCAILIAFTPFLIHGNIFTASFAEGETGSLKVTISHGDGSPASPDDFFASSAQGERQGYFSLEDSEGVFVDVYPTCNESSNSCEIDGLLVGSYTASILLGGEALTVGGNPTEFSQDFDVEAGVLTELAITADYGSVELTVTHLDGQQLASEDFVSEYGLVEGYYSLYDDDGDLVTDAPSCNLGGQSCTVVLASGIYTAIVAPPESLKPYSVVFEISDNSLAKESIQVEIGTFEVTVLDENDEVADSSSFSHPIGYNEPGWFAAYDADGYLIMDGESCNLSDPCTYTYDAGTYEVSIRKLPAHVLLSCIFEITDNTLTPVKLYLDSRGCNQIPVDSDSNDDNGNNSSSDDSNSNDNSNSSSTPNTPDASGSGTAPALSKSLLNTLLQRRTVSIIGDSHYIDQSGAYHVIGEVVNTELTPARDIVVTGVFFTNGTDDLVALKRGHAMVDILRPGERSPFEIVIQDASQTSKIGEYSLSAIYENSTVSSVKPGNLGVNVASSYYSNDTGLYHVSGKVVNYGDHAASFVRVIVSAYNQQNGLVYVGQKYVSPHLLSSSVVDYQFVFTPVNASAIASIYVIVQSNEYGMIPGGKLLESSIHVSLDATSYNNGAMIKLNGTVGSDVPWRYGAVYILWPDGIHFDKEVVQISEDGSFRQLVPLFTLDEFRGNVFTVRVIYNHNFGDATFTLE